MKVLIYSLNFYPLTGGLEYISYVLAKQLQKKGFEITIITYTPLKNKQELLEKFIIIRNPTLIEFLRQVKNCDLYISHNISLKGILPLFFFRRKWVTIHHITYYNIKNRLSILEAIKRQLTHLTNNIACSNFVNDTLPKKGKVILNCYNDEVFKLLPHVSREKELIFVGRLVSDKGCDDLLKALKYLKDNYKLVPKLTVVGEGPDLSYLIDLTKELELSNQVTFTGKITGINLAKTLNEHKIIVVPSRWKEPFGIVALEGLACGCIPIVSENGGLKEAVGEFGLFFNNADITDLAHCIQRALDLKSKINHAIIPKFLENFTEKQFGKNYFSYLLSLNIKKSEI